MLNNKLLLTAALIFSSLIFSCKTQAEGAPAVEKISFPAPETHKGNWTVTHGKAAEAAWQNWGTEENSCSACHTRNDCTSCHQSVMPKTHNGFWKQRSHGLAAEMEAESCTRCHKENTCTTCHNETAPRTHRAGWDKNHCNSCHLPGEAGADDQNCSVCHRSVKHTSAPHPVKSSLNCRNCHL